MSETVACHPAHHVPVIRFTKVEGTAAFKTYITLCAKCGRACTFTVDGRPA